MRSHGQDLGGQGFICSKYPLVFAIPIYFNVYQFLLSSFESKHTYPFWSTRENRRHSVIYECMEIDQTVRRVFERKTVRQRGTVCYFLTMVLKMSQSVGVCG